MTRQLTIVDARGPGCDVEPKLCLVSPRVCASSLRDVQTDRAVGSCCLHDYVDAAPPIQAAALGLSLVHMYEIQRTALAKLRRSALQEHRPDA